MWVYVVKDYIKSSFEGNKRLPYIVHAFPDLKQLPDDQRSGLMQPGSTSDG
jgi:hypothetical protein